jgi:hypothetical protein
MFRQASKVFTPPDRSPGCIDPMQRYLLLEDGRFVKFEPGFVSLHSDHGIRGFHRL